MDMNYGCDVSNRYTGYLDSSDHGNPMSNAAGKNKRKSKKRRKSKNSTQKAVNVVDKCTNTSLIVESDDIQDGDSGVTLVPSVPSEQQQQQQQGQLFDDKTSDHQSDVEHNENDAQYTPDGPPSSISCDSTMQSDTSKDAKESDEQSNNTTENLTTITTSEIKWSVICCEEEKAVAAAEAAAAAAAAAVAMEQQKLRDEPELEFKDQRIYPTVYFYNSNFGLRTRRVVYDFHDGSFGSGGRRQNNHNYHHDGSRTRSKIPDHDDNTEPNNQMENKKPKKRRNRNATHRRKNFTSDNNHPGDTSEMHSTDDVEKYSNTSHNESHDRASYGQSSATPPPVPPPSAQKHYNNNNNNNNNNSNSREYPKNRYNKFKNGMPERTFTRRRTDLVRNV